MSNDALPEALRLLEEAAFALTRYETDVLGTVRTQLTQGIGPTQEQVRVICAMVEQALGDPLLAAAIRVQERLVL